MSKARNHLNVHPSSPSHHTIWLNHVNIIRSAIQVSLKGRVGGGGGWCEGFKWLVHNFRGMASKPSWFRGIPSSKVEKLFPVLIFLIFNRWYLVWFFIWVREIKIQKVSVALPFFPASGVTGTGLTAYRLYEPIKIQTNRRTVFA